MTHLIDMLFVLVVERSGKKLMFRLILGGWWSNWQSKSPVEQGFGVAEALYCVCVCVEEDDADQVVAVVGRGKDQAIACLGCIAGFDASSSGKGWELGWMRAEQVIRVYPLIGMVRGSCGQVVITCLHNLRE